MGGKRIKEKKDRQHRLLGARIAGFKRFREWRRIKYRQAGQKASLWLLEG